MTSPWPETTCCICFTSIAFPVAAAWKCPKCGTRWDMCVDCGSVEGCLTCGRLTI